MIFSLPNMQKWLELKHTNCLNFEHTLFLDESVIKFLLQKHQFKIVNKKYFKDHSIFYFAKLDLNLNPNEAILENNYTRNKNLFLNMICFYQTKIKSLNAILERVNKEIYLFGAHLFSQYLIYNGLCTKKIKGILDNNANKQGKRLYGTNLLVSSPKILEQKNAIVILNAGSYNDEIKNDLQNINKNIEILTLN